MTALRAVLTWLMMASYAGLMALSLGKGAAWAPGVSGSSLPQPVREGLERDAAGGTLTGIGPVGAEGQEFYSAMANIDGAEYWIEVDPDGRLITKVLMS